MKMLEKCDELDDETFVLLVEAFCALSRMNGISTEHSTLQVLAVLQQKGFFFSGLIFLMCFNFFSGLMLFKFLFSGLMNTQNFWL